MKNKYVIMFLAIIILLLSTNIVFAEDTTDNNDIGVSDSDYLIGENNDNQIDYVSNEDTAVNHKSSENIALEDNQNPYFKEDTSYVLYNGSYFNDLIHEIDSSYENQEVTIRLKDDVYLTESFNWNNENVNLYINGFNSSNEISNEQEYTINPYYIFSAPSISVGKNCDLTFSDITLIDEADDTNFITNKGNLTLRDIVYKPSFDTVTESFLIDNEESLQIWIYRSGSFNTIDYSTKTNRRNLIYNKGLLTTYNYKNEDVAPYEKFAFEIDNPNYYVYNEGQIKYFYQPLDNITVESNSEYEYDIIYQCCAGNFFEGNYIAFSGNNVLINDSYIYSDDIINTDNLTIKSSYIVGANINSTNLMISDSYMLSYNEEKYIEEYRQKDEWFYRYFTFYLNDQPKNPKEFNLNVTNFTATGTLFHHPVFNNNTIEAQNIILKSNIFEFNKDFEKATTGKIKDYNKVKLVYDNLIYKDNTLKNFKFINVDTASDETKNNDGTATKYKKQNIKKSYTSKSIQNNKSYKYSETSYQNSIVTLHQNDKITLSWLNNIFNNEFNNQKILIYLGDVLVFNGSAGSDLSEVLFNITEEYKGTYTLKVVSDDSTFTKEVTIL